MSKEDILAEEELEITAATAGAAPVQLPNKVVSIFPALAHRNYQLYFAGQSISLIGFWLQMVGVSCLTFQLTHSAFWVGTVAAIGGLPFLIFTTFAGVFIDKVNKQNLIIWTQIIETVLAIILGLLVLSGTANLFLVIILSFAFGIVGSIDLPARLSFVVEMVGKKDLASAISLNIGVFNAARFVGPAIAGALIASAGVGWAFIANGISFLPAILAVYNIKPVYNYKSEVNIHPLQSLKDGIYFVATHEKLLSFMFLAAITAIFIWPYQTLMPVVAERVFSSGASGLGSLLSAAGFGSLVGAIFISAQTRKENKDILIFGGLLIATISLILFSLNRNFTLAHILLFTEGFGAIMLISTLNTLVQLLSPDQMRGRIMAVYLTMFVGMMPVGNALAGVIAQRTSSLFTIGLGGVIVLIVGVLFYFKRNLAN